jgi:hypothetical protein
MAFLIVLLMFVAPYALRSFREREEKPSTTTQADSRELVNERPEYWVGSGIPPLIANSTSACLESTPYE